MTRDYDEMKRDLKDLPDDARLWVFGADRPLTGEEVVGLEARLSGFFEGWAAHRVDLVAGSRIEERRFVLVGVDEARARASGCSIDALQRVVGELEGTLDVRLRDGSLVFYREGSGEVMACDRAEFRRLGERGEITGRTPVFDTTIDRLAAWRAGRFERPASASWHARLLPEEIAGARRTG
ncbi:MAG: hypothetical protein ACRELC_01975 [Gemmatimonadota bacterium]